MYAGADFSSASSNFKALGTFFCNFREGFSQKLLRWLLLRKFNLL